MNFSSADDFSRAVVEFATDLTARPADVDQEVAA
jgi:hypothetical protein